MRQDDEIEIGKVDAFRFYVGGEDVPVVAGVEQDVLAGDLDQCGKAPILFHRCIVAEGVVRIVILDFGSDSRFRHGRQGGAEECACKNSASDSVS